MSIGDELADDVFLVHQEGVFARVEIIQVTNGWTVRVLDLQQPSGKVTNTGSGFSVPGPISDARNAAIAEARRQIADLTGRDVTGSFQTIGIFAVEDPSNEGVFSGAFEIHKAGFDSAVTDRKQFPIDQRRELNPREALELARRAYERIAGVELGRVVLR